MTKHSQEPDVGGAVQRIPARLAWGVRMLVLRARIAAAAAWPVVRRWALLRPVQLAGMLLIGLLVGGGVVAAVSDSDAKPSVTRSTPTKQEPANAPEDAHKPTKPADPPAPEESGKPRPPAPTDRAKPPAPTDHPKPPNPHTPPNPPGGR